MSFLTILLFSSAFYFAQARPDSVPAPEVIAAGVPAPDVPAPEVPIPEEPENPLEPMIDLSQYKDELDKFMVILTEASDDWLGPMIASLDEAKQKKIKQIEFNTYASCINYMMLLVDNELRGKPGIQENYKNDIVISYEGNDVVDAAAPFIAAREIN